MRAHLRVFVITALCCVPVACVVWLFAVFTDDRYVLKGLLAALIVCVFVAILLTSLCGVWRDYSPAARRRRRGREQLAGPTSRDRISFRTDERRTLGPAFDLESHHARGAHRGHR